MGGSGGCTRATLIELFLPRSDRVAKLDFIQGLIMWGNYERRQGHLTLPRTTIQDPLCKCYYQPGICQKAPPAAIPPIASIKYSCEWEK
jgi:hypothetical protein